MARRLRLLLGAEAEAYLSGCHSENSYHQPNELLAIRSRRCRRRCLPSRPARCSCQPHFGSGGNEAASRSSICRRRDRERSLVLGAACVPEIFTMPSAHRTRFQGHGSTLSLALRRHIQLQPVAEPVEGAYRRLRGPSLRNTPHESMPVAERADSALG